MQPNSNTSQGFLGTCSVMCRLIPPALRRTLVLALLVTLVTSATVNAVPILLGQLVSAMQSSHESGTIAGAWPALALFYLGIILIVFAVREGLQLIRKFLARELCTGVEKDLSLQVIGRLFQANLDFFGTEKIGALQGRVKHGVEAFVTLLKLGLADLAPALFTLVCSVIYALFTQAELGVLLLVAIPVMLLLAAWQKRVLKATRRAVQRADDALAGTLVEQFTGMEYLRAADRHGHEIERLTRLAEEKHRQEIKQQFWAALFEAIQAIGDWVLQIAVITCAVLLIASGRAQIGAALTMWYICFNIIGALKDIFRMVDRAQDGTLRMNDLQLLLGEPGDQSFAGARRESAAPAANEPRLLIDVPFFHTRGLEVEYRTASGQVKRALDGVSVTIHHGEVVGIAGHSGSGKSTLAKVLLRLVHPSAGRAFLGGVPLGNVSREALGRLIGYVGQDPFLFTGTVADNIAYGCDTATAADIRRAAEQACLHDDILRMPGGYGADVGERGRNLSGGQRQRLALARALLNNPPVLVLDEATSALDPATERRVLRSLLANRGQRTLVLVAHRPAALRASDRVLVFDHGCLVEEGHYSELLRSRGLFDKLVKGRARRKRKKMLIA